MLHTSEFTLDIFFFIFLFCKINLLAGRQEFLIKVRSESNQLTAAAAAPAVAAAAFVRTNAAQVDPLQVAH